MIFRMVYKSGARFSKNLMTNLRKTYEKVWLTKKWVWACHYQKILWKTYDELLQNLRKTYDDITGILRKRKISGKWCYSGNSLSEPCWLTKDLWKSYDELWKNLTKYRKSGPWTDLSTVLSQFTCVIDGQTDRQTDRILIARSRVHSMQRGKNPQNTRWGSSLLLVNYATAHTMRRSAMRPIGSWSWIFIVLVKVQNGRSTLTRNRWLRVCMSYQDELHKSCVFSRRE